jgi:PTH1 family peptidyl-tRNA hydrolase
MYLLVGLGNPGSKYKKNRHNVGHMTIDMIVKKYNLKKKNKNKFGDIFEGHLSNKKIFALKPKEFMNLSGISIKKFLDFYKINMKNLLIIHDDIDLPFGKIKIKIGGGNAGHRGLESIDSLIGKNYKRIRIGIDRPKNNKSVDKFVLENFEKTEEKEIKFSINRIISFLQYLISSNTNDISVLMNKLSKK